MTLHPGLHLKTQHMRQMLEDVSQRAPEEACGIIAGKGAIVEVVLTLTNSLHSPVRFRLDAQEQLDAFKWLEQQGLEMLGVYHSHPGGPRSPSQTDITEYAYPGTLMLIWAPEEDGWGCQGYLLEAGRLKEIPLLISRT
ncbi:MAG: M67 family metallopeptidase [Anaerolineales bacterium]|nr:M67 family metallopeptidase [Anaerolineales bacterium]